MMDVQSFATDDFVLEHLADSKAHRQLLESFSVANYHEANRSESRDDFVHKVAIAMEVQVVDKRTDITI